jgi:hypothetical protein
LVEALFDEEDDVDEDGDELLDVLIEDALPELFTLTPPHDLLVPPKAIVTRE